MNEIISFVSESYQHCNICFHRECGCGEGDSGCAECGCCRICARENCDNGGEMAVLGPSGGGDLGKIRLGMIFEGRHLPAPSAGRLKKSTIENFDKMSRKIIRII